MDKCADLLPEHFRFVRGVVDSPDLSLNISRELLQHDRQLKVIAANLEKKIKSELAKMLKDDREAYETFWKNFGRQLKYGVVGEYGAHKDLLQDLLLFWSSTEKSRSRWTVCLPDEGGSEGHLLCRRRPLGQDRPAAPDWRLLKEKGHGDALLHRGSGRVRGPDPAELQGQGVPLRHGPVIELGGRDRGKGQGGRGRPQGCIDFWVKGPWETRWQVKTLCRLKSHPVCLTAGEGLSFEMEKYFQLMQPDSSIKAQRILELNTEHPAFTALENAVTADPEKARSTPLCSTIRRC